MKPFLILIAAGCFISAPVVQAQTAAPEDEYFDVYTLIQKGENLQSRGKDAQAHTNFMKAEKALKKLQEDYPLWEPSVVKYRLGYLQSKEATSAPAAKPGMTGAGQKPVSEIITPGDSAEPVAMKIKWQVGKRYLERLTLGVAGQATQTGQPQPMKGELKLSQDLAISALKERDGGGRDLQVELLDTALNVKQDGNTLMSFDSKKPAPDAAGDPVGPILKRIAGAKLRLLTSAAGNVESVEGLEDFMKTIGGSDMPDPAALLKSVPADVSGNLQTMQPGSAFLPDQPVKVGDTWSKAVDSKADPTGTVAGSIKYTFTGWSQHEGHKCAVIEFAGDLTAKPPAAATAGSAVDIRASVAGKTWFDPELGTIVETSASPKLKAKVGDGMNVTVNLDTDCKLVEMADLASR